MVEAVIRRSNSVSVCYSVSVEEGTAVTEDESVVKIPSTKLGFFFINH